MAPLAEKLPANAEHGLPTPWSEASQRLERGDVYWLTTLRADGQAHVRPVLGVYVDEALFFVASPGSRKARNLAPDGRCVVSVALPDAHLVVEGTAAQVTSPSTLDAVARAYATKYDWHVQIESGMFTAEYGAPTAGPPPYAVFEVTPERVYGFGTTEVWSPTRWRFPKA
jgi:hypothetical protein